MKFFKRGFYHLTDYLVNNIGILLYYSLIISLTGYLGMRGNEGTVYISERHWYFTWVWGIMTAVVCMVIRSLILTIPYRISHIIAALFTTLIVLISMVDFWLGVEMNTIITDGILLILLTSNGKESTEFIQEVILSSDSIGYLIGFIFISLLSFDIFLLLGKWLRSLLKTSYSLPVRVYVLLIVCGLVGLSAYYRLTRNENRGDYDSIQHLTDSIIVLKGIYSQVKALEGLIPEIDGEIKETQNTIPHIIWVIGESESVYHSQLYGYPYPTSPNLVQEKDKGNLMVFTDVITPYANTVMTMPVLFSPGAALDPEKGIFATPAITALLRKGGYNVRLFDNQQLWIKGKKDWDYGTFYFVNTPRLSEVNFDYRHPRTYYNDWTFFNEILSLLGKDTGEPTLDIVHIIGAHFSPHNKYPPDSVFFTPSSYQDYRGKNYVQRQLWADYDNAIRSIDTQMGRLIKNFEDKDVIIIYHSDHGELCCEIDNNYSRVHVNDPKYTAYYYNVPFWIYTTPAFRNNHKDLYERLKSAKNKSFALNYFSHLLGDIAGVKSRFIESRYSPASPDWCNPQRRISGNRDFDSIPLWITKPAPLSVSNEQ